MNVVRTLLLSLGIMFLLLGTWIAYSAFISKQEALDVSRALLQSKNIADADAQEVLKELEHEFEQSLEGVDENALEQIVMKQVEEYQKRHAIVTAAALQAKQQLTQQQRSPVLPMAFWENLRKQTGIRPDIIYSPFWSSIGIDPLQQLMQPKMLSPTTAMPVAPAPTVPPVLLPVLTQAPAPVIPIPVSVPSQLVTLDDALTMANQQAQQALNAIHDPQVRQLVEAQIRQDLDTYVMTDLFKMGEGEASEEKSVSAGDIKLKVEEKINAMRDKAQKLLSESTTTELTVPLASLPIISPYAVGDLLNLEQAYQYAQDYVAPIMELQIPLIKPGEQEEFRQLVPDKMHSALLTLFFEEYGGAPELKFEIIQKKVDEFAKKIGPQWFKEHSRPDILALPQQLIQIPKQLIDKYKNNNIFFRHYKTVQQVNVTCGFHAAINAWAVTQLVLQNWDWASMASNNQTAEKIRELVISKEDLIDPHCQQLEDIEVMNFAWDMLQLTGVLILNTTTIPMSIRDYIDNTGDINYLPTFQQEGQEIWDLIFDNIFPKLLKSQNDVIHFISNVGGHWVSISVVHYRNAFYIILLNSTNSQITTENNTTYQALDEIAKQIRNHVR